ncbi:helix-turn-helix domain-containing protein [Symbiopectobacterium sp. RP]|uniref:helix-turn-helix domain-containing protein n=1 Tax=Symbiopectobacterium sp. RP TaxID=3248553 RepID=UPI003D2925B3
MCIYWFLYKAYNKEMERAKWHEVAKARMRALRITQDELAERLGVTKGGISHWLNGRREPRIEDFCKIMAILGLNKLILNNDGSLLVDNEREAMSPTTSSIPTLTEEKLELLKLFDDLPEVEAKRFLVEMKIKKTHYDALFEEMYKKRKQKVL